MCISYCAVFDQIFRSPSPKKWLFKEIFCLILLVSLSFVTASKCPPASSAYEAITRNNDQFEIESTPTLSTMFTFDPKGSGYEILTNENLLYISNHMTGACPPRKMFIFILLSRKKLKFNLSMFYKFQSLIIFKILI